MSTSSPWSQDRKTSSGRKTYNALLFSIQKGNGNHNVWYNVLYNVYGIMYCIMYGIIYGIIYGIVHGIMYGI